MLATFMEVLDTSIASVALPYIGGNLGATPSEATWVLTSYLVSNAIVLPASGWLSRHFGRKRLLMTCIIIFSASSVLCGAATSLPMLIVARVLQGAGGGALQPLAQSIMLESFPPAKRGTAMAVYGIGVVCAPILGPTLGGWLTDTWSWRWAFYINLPVSIVAVFMISLFVEDPPWIREGKPGRIDGVGLGFMALGLGALQILLDRGQEADWFDALWMRWLAGAVRRLALLFFIFWELRVSDPIVNLRILKNRNFAVACALFFLFGAAIYGLVALQPLFLQTLLGYTALEAGLTVSPRGLGAFFALFVVGALIAKAGRAKAGGFRFCGLFPERISLQPAVLANGPEQPAAPQSGQRFWRRLHFCAVDHRRDGHLAQRSNRQRRRHPEPGAQSRRQCRHLLCRHHAGAFCAGASGVYDRPRLRASTRFTCKTSARVQGVLQSHFSPADARLRAEGVDL